MSFPAASFTAESSPAASRPAGSLADSAPTLTPEEEAQIKSLQDAYIYGYSLVTTEVTRLKMSNVAEPSTGKAPMGQFINILTFPSPKPHVVSAPNADTLYSLCWIDLSEPQVFSHPDMGERYYLFEMTDLWMTDFAAPGSRLDGGTAANYLLTGPGWKGAVPSGMKQFQVATRYMVILGRIYANGSADYAAVNALQMQNKVTPLSAWGKPYTPVAPKVTDPGFSTNGSPQGVILQMGPTKYYNLMMKLMAGDAPPAGEDGPMLAQMATVGIVPGQTFDIGKFDQNVQDALNEMPTTVLELINANKPCLAPPINYWVATMGLGCYGNDYLKRATVAAFGWPANQQEDAVYPSTQFDSEGHQLTGTKRYTLTFGKNETPPVDASAFWSLTMYEINQGWWFFGNSHNRYKLGSTDNLTLNADGSLTLYLQHTTQGIDKVSNWLPAPLGPFALMLRMYSPNQTPPSILDGSWEVPPVLANKE